MKIVADPNIPMVREAFGPLAEVRLVPGRDVTAAAARDAEALLVRSVTPVNAALLDGSRVRFVATATIGTDHIDERYLAGRGIGFASAAGSNANSVAEYVVAALLELAQRHRFELRGKTLGVIGVGNVGQLVVRYATALGMRVLPNDPPRQRAEGLPGFVTLDQVLAEAEVITLHVPLTRQGPDATWHLFDARRLATLRPGTWLINTARGAVVDNPALLEALQDHQVAGAVLDVWEGEPVVNPGLLAAVELATPHIAGYSFDGKVNGTRQIYTAFCRHFGLPATWAPSLPAPAVPHLELGLQPRESAAAALRRLVRHVYDIGADDDALRARPQDFDKLRANYPVRREFGNTRVALPTAAGPLRALVAALGFETT